MTGKEIIDALIENELNRAIAYYGFEKTIEVVNRNYENNIEIRHAFLKAIEKRMK